MNCGNCGNSGAQFKCGKCKSMFYCNVDCQKDHWKTHKISCVIDLCSRCEKSMNDGSICKIPHPISCRKDMGGMFEGGKCQQFYFCEACGKNWTEVKLGGFNNKPSDEYVEGSPFCYEGPHSMKAIPKSDKRVIRSTELNLFSGPNLQNQLDNLSRDFSKIVKLTIHSGEGDYDKDKYSFEANLPQLKVLIIDAVRFSKLILTNQNVPKLSVLNMTNLGCVSPHLCEFKITASQLKEIEIYFMDSDDITPINNMFMAATKLEMFKSRKLWVYGQLQFNSNYLTNLTIVRSDILPGITIWAPRLELLNLSSCYDISSINILDDHPLKSELPQNFTPSIFAVDLRYCCNDRKLLKYLNNNPRVSDIIIDDEDDEHYEGIYEDEEDDDMDEDDEDMDEDDEDED